MGEAFITRKGGAGSEQALAPTILDVVTESSKFISFKLQNNDPVEATLIFRFGTTEIIGGSVLLEPNTTSEQITFEVPIINTPTKLFVTANVVGKLKSIQVEKEFPVPIFTAATGGTTLEYDSGGKRFKSHTFTSNGTFEVTTVGDNLDDRNKVDYLIIAGGGAGATAGNRAGGAGGAGGYLTTLGATSGNVTADAKFTVTASTFGIVIGGGGATNTSDNADGQNGAGTTALSKTAIGGGGGGRQNVNGRGGGSGGGAGASSNTIRIGGNGTSGQGFAGGNGNVFGSTVAIAAAGGGGGAFSVGANALTNNAGNGGDGLANNLRTGSNETRAGGGGGAVTSSEPNSPGLGGLGGGGNGVVAALQQAATPGIVNSGSGGGGGVRANSAFQFGAAGGSGIVVIRYEITPSV